MPLNLKRCTFTKTIEKQCMTVFMACMTEGREGSSASTDEHLPEYMDQLDHFHQVVGLKDGDVIDLGGTTIEMMYLGGHTQHDVVFADHTHRCLFTGDAVGSGYVVGVRYEKNRFHETYAWYRDNLERFIGRMKGKEDYTCFGGHFIQENSCMDEMQEDYLNNQSEYFVPLSWKVIEDMYVLAGELADGMHDKEAASGHWRGVFCTTWQCHACRQQASVRIQIL